MNLPGLTTYNASKAFTSFVAEALAYEWKDKVDVQNYKPGNVDTNMSPKDPQRGSFLTTERAAEACFRDLGLYVSTYGDSDHHLASNMMKVFQKSSLDKAQYDQMKKDCIDE